MLAGVLGPTPVVGTVMYHPDPSLRKELHPQLLGAVSSQLCPFQAAHVHN